MTARIEEPTLIARASRIAKRPVAEDRPALFVVQTPRA
jgi:hypothetical protein